MAAYFLDKELKNRSLLIGIRRIRGSHNNKNITKAIIPIIIIEMGIISNLEYFITNNASTCDMAIKIVLQRLRPNITHPRYRRVRCLDHIINLVAKAFLFDSRKGSFEDIEIDNSTPLTALEAETAF